MVNTDAIFGKVFKHLWISCIAGCVLVLIESALKLNQWVDAGFSIVLSVILIVCAILNRYDVNGTGFTILICSYILFLSPIGFDGFTIGIILILVGSLLSASGGFFTYTSFLFYIAIGAIVVDIIFIML